MSLSIVWIGNPYLAGPMRAMGHAVTVIPARSLVCPQDILASGTPDLFIYGDESRPPFLVDVETLPCLTVFYAIDTHIHSWYPRYAQAFDLCCVAMRDHLAAFLGHRLPAERVRWLPLFARDSTPPMAATAEYDLLFVGKNDPHLTPGRHVLLRELGARVPLTVAQGRYPELYSRARLVLNVAEHGDLNFRVFEALGCASCLITPRVGHGLLDLFAEGRHLFTYDPSDLDGLAALVHRLLGDDDLRVRTGRAGYIEVDSRHRMVHRATTLLEWIAGLDAPALIRERLAARDIIRRQYLRLLYLHFAATEADPARAAMYLRRFAGPA